MTYWEQKQIKYVKILFCFYSFVQTNAKTPMYTITLQVLKETYRYNMKHKFELSLVLIQYVVLLVVHSTTRLSRRSFLNVCMIYVSGTFLL